MTTHRTGRPPVCTFQMGGHQFTAKQLAELAGCTQQALRRRIDRGCTPAEAVAWGPSNRNRPRPNADGSPRSGKFELDGKRYTCRELAEMAGCSKLAMRARLRTLDPAEAVARGASDRHRMRKPVDERKTPVRAKNPKPPKPAKVKQTKTASSAKLSAKSWSIGERKADKRALKPAEIPGEGIRTEKTVVTVAKHQDRFHIDPASVPSIFGRIGQYESTGTAIEAQYR